MESDYYDKLPEPKEEEEVCCILMWLYYLYSNFLLYDSCYAFGYGGAREKKTRAGRGDTSIFYCAGA